MRRSDCLKIPLASAAVFCLMLCSFCETRTYGGWRLTVTFTTTSPGGDLRFDPEHVQAVWAETASGTFVKTIGRWGVLEHGNLTQWAAADGTNIDGWTGATPKAYQEHRVTWDLTDRSGQKIPDGLYYLKFELTNHNAEQNQFRRTTVLFQKDGVARSDYYAAQGGFLHITLDYHFVPTTIPEVNARLAMYVTSSSARLNGQIIDTGGEDPNVYLCWGESDARMDIRRWDSIVDLGQREAGPVYLDLSNLDPSTEYYYRIYAANSAGGRWTDHTESFSTHGRTGYYAGYRVQSGRARVMGKRLDIDIVPVNDTAHAFALISYGTGWQPNAENANVVMARGYLLDGDTVTIERTADVDSTWVSWQVVECLGGEFQVYRGSGTFKGVASSVDAPLNGAPSANVRRRPSDVVVPDVVVDPALCMAYVTADTSAADRLYYHETMLTAYVNTDTTVRIERGAGGHSTVNYNWVVVEFDPSVIAGIEHGSLSFNGASKAAPASRSIRPVNLDSSVLIYQARSTVNGLSYSAVAGRFVSANTVQFYQHTGTSGTRSVEYYVIDFGPSARAQRGQIDFSEDSGWFYADCHLAPPVDLSRAMYFHGLSCNGTGDYYPRPFTTAQFTSNDNLHIERQFPGQHSYIEWQVLELPAGTFFGQEPDISLDPNALAFPAVAVGDHTDLSFDIRNVGDADLQVHSLEFVGLNKTGYGLASLLAVPFTVAPQSNRTVTVRFAPTASQSYAYARLAVGSNDPDEPVVELALDGVAAGYVD